MQGEPRPDDHLAQSFQRLISATGPISLSHFMGESNLHYYTGRDPLGSDGDFITAPEISQMFGEMIGLWLAEQWLRHKKPGNWHYVELGPGRATLTQDILRSTGKFGWEPPVHFIETSPVLRDYQQSRFPNARWHDNLESLPRDAVLIMLANEFFDALPVRQLVMTEAGWREVKVDWNGSDFIEVAGTQPMDSAVAEALRDAPRGSIIETSPACSTIIFEMALRIQQQGGLALIIDYGYDSHRYGSSLQAVRDHEKIELLSAPGQCDISAHVNFAAISDIARTQFIACDGPLGQGEWLKNLGIDLRAQMLGQSHPGKAEMIARALERLTSEDQMGSLFRVCALRPENWPVGEGFAAAV